MPEQQQTRTNSTANSLPAWLYGPDGLLSQDMRNAAWIARHGARPALKTCTDPGCVNTLLASVRAAQCPATAEHPEDGELLICFLADGHLGPHWDRVDRVNWQITVEPDGRDHA